MTKPFAPAAFPYARPRRLRASPWVRRLVAETVLTPADLIWPLIVHDGADDRVPVASMPGVFRLSPKAAAQAAVEARNLGIPAVALFPNVDGAIKDGVGTGATDPDGLIPDCIKAIKDATPEIGVMCDVALDCYTDHGHDGVVEDGRIVNDVTLERLAEQAFIQAHAGADIVAPSDMMDGRVQAIREALEANGLHDTLILSYAAKYASALYGPYRDAVGSAKQLTGDKKTYQMDFANSDEALREVAMDLSEGADAVMVKPGMLYLDIVRRVSETFRVPTFAYQVSGEYSMMRASIANGWLDEDRAILESLHAFKRAGCAGVLSYFAPQAARLLGGMKFGVLKSVVHNAADSLGSGMGFLIGVYQIDIYGEAGRSPGGVISVDFLTGKIIEGEASESLRRAVELYRTAFDDLCVRHGVEPWSFKTATARFGTDSSVGCHFTVHIEDREGRVTTDRFVGSPGKSF